MRVLKIGNEIFTIMRHCIQYRCRCALTEGTFAMLKNISKISDRIQILFSSFAIQNILQQVHQHFGAFFTRSAPTTTVKCLNPLHVFSGHGGNVNILIENYQPVPPHKAPQRTFAIKCYRQFEACGNGFTGNLPVIDNISAPRGKNYLSHKNLRPAPMRQQGVKCLQLLENEFREKLYTVSMIIIISSQKSRENIFAGLKSAMQFPVLLLYVIWIQQSIL
jgi:hypothetical protein